MDYYFGTLKMLTIFCVGCVIEIKFIYNYLNFLPRRVYNMYLYCINTSIRLSFIDVETQTLLKI